jgi:tetratricopeptide (TPR) repeat protein
LTNTVMGLGDIDGVIKRLIDDDLADSAEKVCSLYMASNYFQGNESKLLELHGDSLYALEQYSRALIEYQRALNPSSDNNGDGQQRARSVHNIETAEDARILFKQCLCQVKKGDAPSALRDMESIPKSLRTTKMNVFLGRLYKSSGLRRHAITVFQDALRMNPFAIECIEHLVSLGVSATDIEGLLPPKSDNAVEEKASFQSTAIVSLTRGLYAQQSANFDGTSHTTTNDITHNIS